MTLQIISAEEIIQFHDRLLRVTPGVAGMPDPGRAEAIMYRVLNKIEYEGVTDVWRLAAMHLLRFLAVIYLMMVISVRHCLSPCFF